MLAMSLLLCCSSPRPSRPRWRSAGRRRSTTHPSSGRSAAEDGGGETFLPREEWAKPRGRKSHRRRCGTGDRGAAVLWPDQAVRGRVARRSDSTEEKTWRISNNLHKRPATSGDGKETLAYRWVGHCTSRRRPHSAPIAHGIASARDAVSVPSKRCDDRPAVTRRRSGIGSAIQPLRRRTAGSTLLGHRRQRNRHAGGDALSGIGRGREGHAHPGRSRHDNCANHCDCLLPAIGGYTDVREAERSSACNDERE
jgi:hypothetical protein